MAAFLALLPTLLDLLPSIIKFVELLHGPGNGSTKLASAVTLVQQLVPEVAPHLTSDPAKLDMVNKLISFGVGVLNATGKLPKPVAVAVPDVQQPAAGS